MNLQLDHFSDDFKTPKNSLEEKNVCVCVVCVVLFSLSLFLIYSFSLFYLSLSLFYPPHILLLLHAKCFLDVPRSVPPSDDVLLIKDSCFLDSLFQRERESHGLV